MKDAKNEIKTGSRVKLPVQSLAAGATMDYVVEGKVIEVLQGNVYDVQLDEPFFRTHQGWIDRIIADEEELILI